jgi:hypothetical protein
LLALILFYPQGSKTCASQLLACCFLFICYSFWFSFVFMVFALGVPILVYVEFVVPIL